MLAWSCSFYIINIANIEHSRYIVKSQSLKKELEGVFNEGLVLQIKDFYIITKQELKRWKQPIEKKQINNMITLEFQNLKAKSISFFL